MAVMGEKLIRLAWFVEDSVKFLFRGLFLFARVGFYVIKPVFRLLYWAVTSGHIVGRIIIAILAVLVVSLLYGGVFTHIFMV